MKSGIATPCDHMTVTSEVLESDDRETSQNQ